MLSSSTMLTKIILKLPTTLVNRIPSKSLTCDVKTCIAAPVVKPETSVSDSNVDIIPNLKTYITSCEKELIFVYFEFLFGCNQGSFGLQPDKLRRSYVRSRESYLYASNNET